MRLSLFISLILFQALSSVGQNNTVLNTSATVYDTCRTYVYYHHLSNPGVTLQIVKARTVQDDGVICVGYIFDNSNRDPLVIKYDRIGSKIWQKRYGEPGYDEEFTGFREMPNRELLMVGIAKNNTTQKKALLFTMLSEYGELLWKKAFSNFPAAANINTAKIYLQATDRCFFAAESDSAIIYGLIDTTGNLIWQRSIRTDTTTKLVDVSAVASNLLIAVNAIDSGHHVVKTYYINYLTGEQHIQSTKKFGGYSVNSDYILHDMEQVGQYSYFSGIGSVNSQPYQLIRLNINQGSILEALENIVTPGLAIDKAARSAVGIYADCIAFTSRNKSGDIYLIKMTGSNNPTTNVYWSYKISLPDTITLNGILKTWDAGHLIYGTKDGPAAPEKRIVQIKIDSAVIIPTCILGRQSENFSVNRSTGNIDTAAYTYAIDSLIPYSYSFNSINNIASNFFGFCQQFKCPSVPVADTCLNSFHRQYQGLNPGNTPVGIVEINKSVYISGAETELYYHPQNERLFVLKMNADGHILKQRNYAVDERTMGGGLIKTRDSSLFIYGLSDSAFFTGIVVAKLDTNLNINWIRSIRAFNFPVSTGGFGINDAKQSSDGSYFLLASNTYNWIAGNFLNLIKLDANGNFLWSKAYRFNYPVGDNAVTGSKLALDGSYAYIMANKGNSSSASAISLLLKADQTNGSLLWCKQIADPSDHLSLGDFMNVYNNEIYFTGTVNPFPEKNIILKTDLDGNVSKVRSHSLPSGNSSWKYYTSQNADGSLNLVSYFYPTAPPPFINLMDCNIKLNSNLDVIFAKKRLAEFRRDRMYTVLGSDQSLYQTGYEFATYNDPYASNSVYVVKYLPDGNIGVCTSDSLELVESSTALTTTPVTCIQSDTVFTLRIPVNVTEQHYMAEKGIVCSSLPGCDTLKIIGQDTICNSNAVYTYTAHRNSGCNSPIHWDYDQSEIQLINMTDSTISVKFLKYGDIKLKVTLYSNCIPKRDSVYIHVVIPPDSLNLGPDTILCNNSAIVLRAGKGYKTYKWQDGSADSVFTASTAGIYYVTVTDSCNTVFTDTVTVLADTFTPFDLGADTVKCNKDTVLLQINAGFTNYTWTPVVNMIPVSPLMVKVFPDSSMYYYVTALKANGCLLKDSVKVTVNHSPVINLGADASLCIGDSLQLNAGNGFITYLWSTGQSTPFIYVNTTGTYYVTATDANQCISTDALSILQMLPLPVIHLPVDSVICIGQNKILDAGPGFSSYLWNTGSINRTISVSAIGNYWVRVSAANGCKASDTAHIKIQQPSPAQFLSFSDSSICQYDTLSIKPNNIFTSYLWSTGSTAPVLSINTPGVYWLRVIDAAGCIGRDTATIKAKPCFKEIYFPSSFTPNHDGLNDTYRPSVYGSLALFHMIIYNRYGQKVFESTDPLNGWNGQLKGSNQPNGGFVWQCTYQFRGSIVQTERGSFLLIR